MKIISQFALEISGGNDPEKPAISVEDLIIWDQPTVDSSMTDWCGTKPRSKNNTTDLI